jgi:hypothetical protein
VRVELIEDVGHHMVNGELFQRIANHRIFHLFRKN